MVMSQQELGQFQREIQLTELTQLEQREEKYAKKLASLEEMTNVFLVALMTFFAVWINLLLYSDEIGMDLLSATWEAFSMGCVIAIVCLFFYSQIFTQIDKKAKTELMQKRVQLGIASDPSMFGAPQPQQSMVPQMQQMPQQMQQMQQIPQMPQQMPQQMPNPPQMPPMPEMPEETPEEEPTTKPKVNRTRGPDGKFKKESK